MKYLYSEFEGYTYYFELQDDGYATRQISMSDAMEVQLSCFMPALAEGKLSLVNEEGEGILKMIDKSLFEQYWTIHTAFYRKIWEYIKKDTEIGDSVEAQVLYFYPQGTIAEANGRLFLYLGERPSSINLQIKGEVIGFDEDNMWTILK